MGTPFGHLSPRAFWLSAFFFVASPFFIYYITFTLFHRKARSNASGKTPPTIPFCFPVIFHAFSLAISGPQKYFAQTLKDFGEFGPFFVNAGPQRLLVIRDAKHIEKVKAASRALTPGSTRLEVFDKLYGSPPKALDCYAGKGVSEEDKNILANAHIKLTLKYLTGVSLSAHIENFVSTLSENLNNKMFQVGSWTQIEDSWVFLRQVITRCNLEALFGKDLLKQYPAIIKDYWEFADAIEGFVPGLPRYWVPGAALKIRERLHQGIEKWLKANHSGSEFARIAVDDPSLDDLKGSKFIQERDSVLAKLECMDIKARAAEMLSIIHETNAGIIPCTIWSLLEVIRRPRLSEQLMTSIARYSPSRSASYNVDNIASLPPMRSLLAEVVRLRTAPIQVHISQQSLVLDEHWAIPCATPIITFSHDLALNTEAWAKAQPRTVEKSLEEFWPERHLSHEGAGSKSTPKSVQSGVPSSSAIVESLIMGSGFGDQSILGSEHARATHAATLAVLLNEFEIQLCDAEFFDAVLPPAREVAFGMLTPLENVAVRIRKRTSSRGQN